MRSTRALKRLVLWSMALGFAVVAAVALFAWGRAQSFPVAALAKGAPERTALMQQRAREARAQGKPFRLDRRWVPYARINRTLRAAVLIAEDDAFFSHGGLDWNELEASARENLKKRRIARGGSTITQQLAKNLYLGDARTPTRKLTELFVALRLERDLSKRRIFELYLNSIEWGDGIFGIEAAAQRYFHVSASRLSPRQSVLLAAVIINPRKYSPLNPSKRIVTRVRLIAGRLRRRGLLDDEQYRIAIGAPAPPAVRPDDVERFTLPADSMPSAVAPPALFMEDSIATPGVEASGESLPDSLTPPPSTP